VDLTGNPFVAVLDWLASQAPDVKDDLGLRLRLWGGDASIPEDAQRIGDQFIERLRGSERSIGDAGAALQARAVLDIHLSELAGSWERAVRVREILIERSDSPTLRENMKQQIREFPLRHKRWQQVQKDWLAVRERSVCDEAVSAFVEHWLKTGEILQQ